MIMRKNHEGDIKLFSASPPTKTVKDPWGCVADCRFPVQAGGNICFGMKNRNNSQQAFRADQFDPSLWNTSDFTTTLMSLRSTGEEQKLARLLSMVLHSKPFVVKPDDSKFDKDGLEIAVSKNIDEATRQEAVEFLGEAVSASMAVESLTELPGLCRGGRKRDTVGGEEVQVKKKKLSRQEEIVKAKQIELDDEEGIEREIKVSGRMTILMDMIENSKHLEKENPVNAVRVTSLVSSMEQNFDLSQLVLTVTLSNAEKDRYDCIQGRNRLAALKLMDQRGTLTSKKGFSDRKVMCVVIETNTPSTQSYIHHRGNRIQANIRKFNPVQVIYSIENLRLLHEKEMVTETIRRFGVQLELPAEDVSLLKKLSAWLSLYTIIFKLNNSFFFRSFAGIKLHFFGH